MHTLFESNNIKEAVSFEELQSQSGNVLPKREELSVMNYNFGSHYPNDFSYYTNSDHHDYNYDCDKYYTQSNHHYTQYDHNYQTNYQSQYDCYKNGYGGNSINYPLTSYHPYSANGYGSYYDNGYSASQYSGSGYNGGPLYYYGANSPGSGYQTYPYYGPYIYNT